LTETPRLPPTTKQRPRPDWLCHTPNDTTPPRANHRLRYPNNRSPDSGRKDLDAKHDTIKAH
ncbi:MAG: hypothetical protein ABW346_10510, partial [Terrimicrobium sp.]